MPVSVAVPVGTFTLLTPLAPPAGRQLCPRCWADSKGLLLMQIQPPPEPGQPTHGDVAALARRAPGRAPVLGRGIKRPRARVCRTRTHRGCRDTKLRQCRKSLVSAD